MVDDVARGTHKDRTIHDKGLVTILKQIHDDLDEAVLESYGWDLRRHDIPVVHAERDAQGSLLTGDSAAAPVHPRQECRGSLSFADSLARGGPEGEALTQQLLTRLAACFDRKSLVFGQHSCQRISSDSPAPVQSTSS